MSGAKGTKLFQFQDINQPSQAQITAADLRIPIGDRAILGYGVPRTVFRISSTNQEQSSANSIYNALQVSLRTSGWHGLTSQGELRLVAFHRYRQRSRGL